ncbi:Os11g0141450 [Oryza sativa Japonica Group]|uniref:Os11g0141450 protein n=1 Tax=Oryza sativa subsp. japonica TaxID=39947 RepID=C7J8S0_ORYSJ|nr:Os11g0141450 [Oryza sativa Japonica Group]|eukprot:NP_001176344.1 Os11g0141450 [Oryza sativa Japonica Group]
MIQSKQAVNFTQRTHARAQLRPSVAASRRRRAPRRDGVERPLVPAEEEAMAAGVVPHLVRPRPPAALQQLPRLHGAAVAQPHPLHAGRLHPRRPLPRPLVPLHPLRPLARHHAADLLPEQHPLHARALRRRRRAPLQAVEQRRVVVERLVEPLLERAAVVVRLLLRHHHDLRGQRPHRRQEAPQLWRRRRRVRRRCCCGGVG